MARLTAHLIPKLDPRHGRRGRPARILAAVTVLALLLASLAPGWALAAEAESEGEGQGTTPPGIGNPDLEPGGPETLLPSVPGSAGGEESEGSETAPVETEPAYEPAVPEAPPEPAPAPAAPETNPTPPATTPPPAEAPPPPEYSPGAPEYSPDGPGYQAQAPPSAVVENEALVAPPDPGATAKEHPSGHQTGHQRAPEPAPQEPALPAPVAPEPPASPAVTGVAPESGGRGPGHTLAGRSSYTVHSGDCLWFIAEGLLPAGASNAQIAGEVARLWQMNAARIGTGDPNLIYAGTSLRLH
ncbi:MAG: hypothetical protein AB7V58_04890 [Solirubrobacterales bacterium]